MLRRMRGSSVAAMAAVSALSVMVAANGSDFGGEGLCWVSVIMSILGVLIFFPLCN